MRKFGLSTKMAVVVLIIVANLAISAIAVTQMAYIDGLLRNITDVVSPRMLDGITLRDIVRRIMIAESNLFVEDTRDGINKASKELEELSKKFLTESDQAWLRASQQGKERLHRARKAFVAWKKVNQDVQNQVLIGNHRGALAMSVQQGKDIRSVLQTELSQFVEQNRSIMDEESYTSEAEYEHARGILIEVCVAATLFGIFLAFVIVRALTRSIDDITRQLNENSSQVALASQQIATSSNGLSNSTRAQAESIESTSQSIKEISAMAKRNAGSARMGSDLSSLSHDAIGRAKQVVDTMVEAFTAIHEVNSKIVSQLPEGQAVAAESRAKVDEGIKVVLQCSEVLDEILNNVTTMSKAATDIAEASAEQSRRVQVITKTMQRLDEVTKDNAILSQDAATVAEQLSGRARDLRSVVATLMRTIRGGKSRDTGPSGVVPDAELMKPDKRFSNPNLKQQTSDQHEPVMPQIATPSSESDEEGDTQDDIPTIKSA